MSACNLCPRQCGVDRASSHGFCGAGEAPVVARAALHFFEEPCISGERGSGAVFFSGCNLRCVFCQNHTISRAQTGKTVSPERLREIYFELISQGAHNINLVTPSHYARAVARSLEGGLPVPVVWNCGGYESVETLRMLEGKVQIYLPDFKYTNSLLAKKYSAAPDYPKLAEAALLEMYRQTGNWEADDDGILQKGVLIRHLVLPGNLPNTFGVIDRVRALFPETGQVLFSLMSQYTPVCAPKKYPELCRALTAEEYELAEQYLFDSGIEDGFVQDRASADERYIPAFDGTGV